MKWMKYDLHMHSNASKSKDGDKKNVKSMTPEDFLAPLILEEIDVFSITDHNCIDEKYYKELINYINTNDLSIKLLMGVELDVKIKLNDGSEPFLNILFYFKEHYSGISKVISDLFREGNSSIKTIIDSLNSKDYNYLIIPEGTGNRSIPKFINKMTPEEAKIFNVYGMYKIFGGFDKTVKESFNAEMWAVGFYQQSIELARLIESYPGDIRNLISKVVKFFKSGEELTDAIEVQIADEISTFSPYLARFMFSDWHNAKPYINDFYNHIFGDESKPFESFELALIDPESRLVVNKTKNIISNNSFIKQIDFDINGSHRTINFTEGLNVIIGERGSGKSLLHTIINSLKEGKTKLNDYIEQYDIKNVVLELNNNQKISYEIPFESMEVIDQQAIKEYFINQVPLDRYLNQNFKEIDKIDISLIDRIIELSALIIEKKNLKENLTPIIDNIVPTDGYIISSKEPENTFKVLKSKHNELKASVNEFYKEAKRQGYSVDKFYSTAKGLMYYTDDIMQISSSQHDFKNAAKTVIDEAINKSSESLNRTQNAYEIIDDYKVRVGEYMDSYLNNEKMNYAIEKLVLKKPKPSIVWHELGYLFVKTSKLKDEDNIIDKIKSTIVGCVYRGNNQEFEKQIFEVLIGKTRFNKDKNIHVELEKFRNGLEMGTQTKLYKCSEQINLSGKQLSLEDLLDLEKRKLISSVTDGSLGMKTAAYLDFAFESKNEILLFDQPEDNIDNMYISKSLVKLIKAKKRTKQLIFVTHNPSLAVYADAFNYIIATKEEDVIEYNAIEITDKKDKDKILDILDGGKYSFSNRNSKYGNIIGGLDYES